METLISKNKLSALLLVSLSAVGCSQVEFSDGQDHEALALEDSANPNLMKYQESYTQQAEGGKIDILIIDDNSGSMVPKQAKMGQRIKSFLSKLEGVDWQIGITTTDVSDGPFGLKGSFVPMVGASSSILSAATPNAETVFLNTIVRQETINCSTSICPSGDEQGLRAAILAMQKYRTENAGFFRDDSKLAIVEISDEDEKSDGTQNPTRGRDVLDAAYAIWGAKKPVTFYGLVTEPGDDDCKGPSSTSASQFGYVLAEFASISGGLIGSICADDYGDQLATIGNSVRSLAKSYELKKAPEGKSFHIEFTPPQPNVVYEVRGKRLVYTVPPAKGTLVQIQYEAAK